MCISCKFYFLGFIQKDLNNLKITESLKFLKKTKREKNKKMEKLSFYKLILNIKEKLWTIELILYEEFLKLCIKIPKKNGRIKTYGNFCSRKKDLFYSLLDFSYRINLWTELLVFVKTAESRNRKKRIAIRMNPDDAPLFHIKQLKNICCSVSQKIDSKEKRNLSRHPKYISQYKIPSKDRKKIILFVCFN